MQPISMKGKEFHIQVTIFTADILVDLLYSLGVAQVTYFTTNMGMTLIHATHLYDRE